MTVETGQGYLPGILGWCVVEHGRYYANAWSFGSYFEAKVAAGLSDFLNRLAEPGNHLFWAAEDGDLLGTLSLDGGDAEGDLAHLRWFICSDRSRGKGIGAGLMARAVAQARSDGFQGIYLTTFAGLDAARRLYDKSGFDLVHEAEDTTWGPRMLEQRFELRF